MKNLYKLLLLLLLIVACKTSINDGRIMPKNKANLLEHTKWKASGASINDGDSILDFHTDENVKEYVILNGNEIIGRQGIYKVKNRRVKIEWSQLIIDHITGTIQDKTMKLSERSGLKTTTYHKIAEY